jgi:hypothetical protein
LICVSSFFAPVRGQCLHGKAGERSELDTMNPRALSILVFGIYLASTGAALLLAPNLVLALLKIPPTSEIWIRLMGALCMNIGCFNMLAARRNLADFFRWMVGARLFFAACIVTFVTIHLATPVFLLFAAVDFLGAMWTLAARGAK